MTEEANDTMARKPIELTDEQRGEIETLGALLNQDQIADYLGIGRTTFHAIMERDPDIAERYKRGKAKAIAHVAQGPAAEGALRRHRLVDLLPQDPGRLARDRPARTCGRA